MTGWRAFYAVHGSDKGRLLGYQRSDGDMTLSALLGTKTGRWFWSHSDGDDIHNAESATDAMEKADLWAAEAR